MPCADGHWPRGFLQGPSSVPPSPGPALGLRGRRPHTGKRWGAGQRAPAPPALCYGARAVLVPAHHHFLALVQASVPCASLHTCLWTQKPTFGTSKKPILSSSRLWQIRSTWAFGCALRILAEPWTFGSRWAHCPHPCQEAQGSPLPDRGKVTPPPDTLRGPTRRPGPRLGLRFVNDRPTGGGGEKGRVGPCSRRVLLSP